MPAFRNVPSIRHSGRLGHTIPVIYDKEGWPIPESILPLSSSCSIKEEPLDGSIPSTPVASPAPLSDYAPSLPISPSHPEPRTQGTDRRGSHSRRRGAGYIPRPRNAFIIFRSAYVASATANGEGQQNEFSKQAANRWNKMSLEDKQTFVDQAAREKKEHSIKYPNYVYSPGKSTHPRKKPKPKSHARARKASGPLNSPAAAVSKRKRVVSFKTDDAWSRSSATPSNGGTPMDISPIIVPRSPRIIRAAAKRASERIRAPTTTPSPRLGPVPDQRPVKIEKDMSVTSIPRFTAPAEEEGEDQDADFVPTGKIPVLELSPPKEIETKREEVEPKFDIPAQPAHIDRVLEQFGFRPSFTSPMLSTFPPIPKCPEVLRTPFVFTNPFNRRETYVVPGSKFSSPTSASAPSSPLKSTSISMATLNDLITKEENAEIEEVAHSLTCVRSINDEIPEITLMEEEEMWDLNDVLNYDYDMEYFNTQSDKLKEDNSFMNNFFKFEEFA